MGWFENQIEERRNADQTLLEDSFVKIAGVVLGQRTAQKLGDERIVTKNAIDEILKYYHYKPVEVPEKVKTAEEQLDYCLRPYGLMRRNVELRRRACPLRCCPVKFGDTTSRTSRPERKKV